MNKKKPRPRIGCCERCQRAPVALGTWDERLDGDLKTAALVPGRNPLWDVCMPCFSGAKASRTREHRYGTRTTTAKFVYLERMTKQPKRRKE